MSAYEKTLSEHRRCSILRTLAEVPGSEANESLLRDVLETFGLTCSRDKVRTELAWLAEQGLVTTEDVAGVTIATITVRGVDVATGRTTVPGVKRPTPKG